MKVSQAITSRRSIKQFDPEHRMTTQETDQLIALAMHAPTAFNIQNWRFVVVQDPAQRQRLRAASWDQAQVTDASLLIVLAADLRSWEKDPARYWKDAPQAVQNYLVPAIDQYYRGNEEAQRDEAMRSCGMAAMTLMLAAQELGYESCPMDGFDFEAVGRLIDLPADHVISMFVAIGKPLRAPWPRGGQLPMHEIRVTDRFSPEYQA